MITEWEAKYPGHRWQSTSKSDGFFVSNWGSIVMCVRSTIVMLPLCYVMYLDILEKVQSYLPTYSNLN